MKATGVIVRFLSLLDVALILLGVLMITLMQTQLRSDAKQGSSPADRMLEVADLDFVYLYAGWKEAENGKCYLLDANCKPGQEEVRTDTADDIRKILTARRTQTGRTNQVVLLLFSDDGWYSAWDEKKLADIRNTWKVEVTPVYNVRLRGKESP